MHEHNVHKWCREFKDGRSDVHDKQRSVRPVGFGRNDGESGKNNAKRLKDDGSEALQDDL